MELADKTAHQALAYVAATQRQGYTMTAEELLAYMELPGRRQATRGTSPRTITTTAPERWLQEQVRASREPLLTAIRQAAGVQQRKVPGTPDKPGETIVQWLTRLRWLTEQNERVRITALGDAVLAHLEQTTHEPEIPVAIVLNQGDELASAKVIGEIAAIGPCALVDPYFSIAGLLHLVNSTQVERVLTSRKDAQKVAELEIALSTVNVGRPFAIRTSEAFHDRLIVPASGSVRLLGTSLTGLGNKLSVMVKLDEDSTSRAIRGEFETAWASAEPLRPATGSPEASSDDGTDESSDS